MIMVVLLAGAGVGFGVFLGWRALNPGPPPLTRLLAGFQRPGVAVADLETEAVRSGGGWPNRLGETTLAFLESTGLADSGELARRLLGQ